MMKANCLQKIKISGPKLGRPNPATTKTNKKLVYQDNTDRIAVEREFSREKRCYGLGKIVTKLEKTQLTSMALSVFVANLFKIQRRILFALKSDKREVAVCKKQSNNYI